MISVVIPTFNSERTLAATLTALVPAAVEGLVREVVVVDGGSGDRTRLIAEEAGADVVVAAKGRGAQLEAGARRTKFNWLLFLHADTALPAGWEREAGTFVDAVDAGRRPAGAAAFRFGLDDDGPAPRILETLVGLRNWVFRKPYGDQGLLIPRSLYDEAGGYKPLAIMEDVEFVGRLGRKRIHLLRATALTSAARYRRDGYIARVARNQSCLALYFLGAPASRIAKLYDPEAESAIPKQELHQV